MPRDLAHLSDEAVVALAARSDDVAFAELYDRYGRIAYGLALRVLRDEALAEDAVQEAFLAIWRGASRFIPERGRASSWILHGAAGSVVLGAGGQGTMVMVDLAAVLPGLTICRESS